MRKIILTLLLLFHLAAIGQTKKETIDWINSKFTSSAIMTDGVGSNKRFLSIQQDGSFKIQGYDYSPDVMLPNLENYRFKTLFTGHFKDLSLNSVTTQKIKGNVYFYASCVSGKCITQQNQGRTEFGKFYNNEVLLGVTSDISLEARCKKAFIHLIKLCGGKSEAF